MQRDTVPTSKPIPVKLPLDVLERIDKIAKRIGEPRSTIMRIAMRVGLDQLEKIFAGDIPKNLSSLLYPSPREESAVIEDRPAKPKKPKAA